MAGQLNQNGLDGIRPARFDFGNKTLRPERSEAQSKDGHKTTFRLHSARGQRC